MIILFGIVLKIPVGFGIWLVYWASKSYDEQAEGEAPGQEDHGFRRWRREPKHPKAPRRGGPHGGSAIATPPRTSPPAKASRPERRITV